MIVYLQVFLVILDTVIIIQLNNWFPHVPNLIREVTTLTWDVWINWIRQLQIKYDFVKSVTEAFANST